MPAVAGRDVVEAGGVMGRVEPDDGLAALLLALKERSGLSYGVLARRLHMSTSTVHRYCSGETVPLDYAPVERFARLGKATPDELAELHRQWVIANERRQTREAARSASRPVEETPEATEPSPEPATAAPEPPTRRRWIVAALVTAGLILAVTVPVAARDLRHDERDPKGTALVPVEADRTPTTTPTPAASKPARTPNTKKSVAAAPSRTEDKPASSTTAPGTTALDTGPPPLHFTVNGYDTCENRDILVDRPPSGVSPPPEVANTGAWVTAFNGIQAGGGRITVTVQGTSDETVVLHALHVRTVKVADPPSVGSVYNLDDGCGGGVPTTYFDLNLDAPHPEPRSPKEHALPRKVSADDPEELLVQTSVEAHDVTWYLELEWSSGGRHGTMRIDNHGRPFRNTGAEKRPQYYFDYDAHQWKPV